METLATASKILFVYPNNGTELRIPLAISILIAKLRQKGHEVKLFDATFYGKFQSDNDKMTEMGTHQKTDLNHIVGSTNMVDPLYALDELIENFNPDLICVSLVERNFNTAKRLLQYVEVPVLVGGIMPSIAPDYLLDQDWVDYICVGEGEDALTDFLDQGIINSPNIWSKEYENPKKKITFMEEVPEQDWTDFDPRHLYKPFMGHVYTGGAFEFSRGCHRSCSFCVAPKLRALHPEGYHRTKSPEKTITEIEHKCSQYGLQMIAFGDTDFLSGVPKEIMMNLLQMYAKRINLPFTMQASIPTLLDEDILKMLHMAKCCAVSVGVESGSEKIRKDVMKKHIPTDMIKKALDLCRKHKLRVTANYMVGLPNETEADVRETIKFNHVINPPSIAVTYFTPFMGTELYDVCVKEGYYRPFQENVYDYPPLDMPQLKQNRIKELCKEFTDDFKTYQDDFSIIG